MFLFEGHSWIKRSSVFAQIAIEIYLATPSSTEIVKTCALGNCKKAPQTQPCHQHEDSRNFYCLMTKWNGCISSRAPHGLSLSQKRLWEKVSSSWGANAYCRGLYSFLYINQRGLLCGSHQIMFPRPWRIPTRLVSKATQCCARTPVLVRVLGLMVIRKLNEGSKNEFPIFVGNPMSSSLQFCHGSVDPSFQMKGLAGSPYLFRRQMGYTLLGSRAKQRPKTCD